MNEERDTGARLWHPWLKPTKSPSTMITTSNSMSVKPRSLAASDRSHL